MTRRRTQGDDDHEHRRFQDFISRGDGRQLWALDRRTANSDELFFISEGEAPALRAGWERGRFGCPVPRCPYPVFKMVRGGSRRDHFVHDHDPNLDHDGPTAARIYSRELIRRIVLASGGHTAPADADFLDMSVTLASGRQVGVALICEAMSVDEWDERDRLLGRSGLDVVWFMRNRRPLLRTSTTEWMFPAVRLGALHRSMRQRRIPLAWFNTERNEIAREISDPRQPPAFHGEFARLEIRPASQWLLSDFLRRPAPAPRRRAATRHAMPKAPPRRQPPEIEPVAEAKPGPATLLRADPVTIVAEKAALGSRLGDRLRRAGVPVQLIGTLWLDLSGLGPGDHVVLLGRFAFWREWSATNDPDELAARVHFIAPNDGDGFDVTVSTVLRALGLDSRETM